MENTIKSTDSLAADPIGRLLARYALPGIASLVINALYNIVDQIFIGRGVGYLGNGATNVVFPLATLAAAFALLIGDGAASYMSLMQGKREQQKAAQGAAAGLITIAAVGVVFALLYLLFLEPLCRLFGATDAILPYAKSYGAIIAVGLPFCSVCAGYASIIRADGSPKYNMAGLLTGCALNIILDPIFIFVCHWGVSGAAFATIIGQIANAIINFVYIPRMKSVKISRDDVKKSRAVLPALLKLGVSSFISQMVLVVVMAVQNNILREYGAMSEYGAEIPISALGVTMKVFNILMMIAIGLASGAQPIWGYNYGARLYKRVQKVFNIVIAISTVVMLVAFAVFQLFPMSIVSIFGSEDEIYNQFAIKTLRIFLLLVPVSGVQLVAGIFFQAVGKPVQASLISLSKQIVFMIPAMFILSSRLGVEGVLWSGPVSDALAFILTVILLSASWRGIFGGEAKQSTAQTENVEREQSANSVENKPKAVVAIGRSFGAGGRAIGKKLACRLGVPYYDRDVILHAAEESGLSAEFLESVDESVQGRGGMLQSLPAARVSTSNVSEMRQKAEAALVSTVERLGAKSPCVIVGRRADQILKGKQKVFSVFITLPLEKRIDAVSSRDNISRAEAEKLVKAVDKKRAEFYNFTGSGIWGVAENYDLCLNLASFSEDEAVALIADKLRSI